MSSFTSPYSLVVIGAGTDCRDVRSRQQTELTVVICEREVVVGPLLAAESPPCADCFTFWLRMHQRSSTHAKLDHQVWVQTASVIEDALATDGAKLNGMQIRLDFQTGDVTEYPVPMRANCVHCQKGHSAQLPLDALLNPCLGLIDELVTIPESPFGMGVAHGVAVGRRITSDNFSEHVRMAVGGSSLMPRDPRLALLMEAAERHSLLYWPDDRGRLNCEHLPSRITDHTVRADLLTGKEQALVPAEAVFLGFSGSDHPTWDADTNGCGAGLSYADALESAIYELVERDALARWWFFRPRGNRVDLDGDEFTRHLASTLREAQCRLWCLDITDRCVGIPVVVACLSNSDGERIYLGASARSTRQEATRKACQEAVQFWLLGGLVGDPDSKKQWLENATTDNEPWIEGRPGDAVSIHRAQEKLLDLPAIVNFLMRSGYKIFHINMTRPWLQIPVARVIIPGLSAQSRTNWSFCLDDGNSGRSIAERTKGLPFPSIPDCPL